MKVLKVCGPGLGYNAWMQVDRYGACDVLLMPCGQRVAHCHPVIPATAGHAAAIEGVSIGDLICGVRWTEPYHGQPTINA